VELSKTGKNRPRSTTVDSFSNFKQKNSISRNRSNSTSDFLISKNDTEHSKSSEIKLPKEYIENLFQLWTKNSINFVEKQQFESFFNNFIKPELDKLEINPLINIQKNDLQNLFNFIDKNGNGEGKINFEDFVLFMSKIKNLEADDEIRFSFMLYDTKGTGQISKQDLIQSFLEKKHSNSIRTATNSMFGIMKRESFLVDCLVEEIFETSEVSFDSLLTVNDVLKGFHKNPSILSKFAV